MIVIKPNEAYPSSGKIVKPSIWLRICLFFMPKKVAQDCFSNHCIIYKRFRGRYYIIGEYVRRG